jgi:protease-4
MSDANREQVTVLLNSLNSVTADISKSRNISVDKLNKIANGLLARTPEMALEQKLVDIIAYEDVYHNAIKKSEK